MEPHNKLPQGAGARRVPQADRMSHVNGPVRAPDPLAGCTRPTTRSLTHSASRTGVDPGIITRLIGHADIEMTEHYRDVSTEELLKGMETIDDRPDLRGIDWKDE